MKSTRRTLLGGIAAAAAGQYLSAAKTDTIPVFMDHDGGFPDDYLALALVLTMPNVKLIGVTVTAADSYIEPAMTGTRKVLAFFKNGAPLAASDAKGVHPFPAAWRKTSAEMDRLLSGSSFRLDGMPNPAPVPGHQLIVAALRGATEPVTILATGPLTNIAAALELAPEIEDKIREIVWMGGALQVKGNVEADDHDGSAEWNSYWDPPAVARVWKSKVPITLCPLDVTNRVPVLKTFLEKLAKRGQFGEIAAKAYTIGLGQGELFFWDVLAASWLGKPDMFTVRNWETVVDVSGKSQGRIHVEDGGRKIRALQRVDPEDFHRYLLAQWKR